jgi:hypothetical protein
MIRGGDFGTSHVVGNLFLFVGSCRFLSERADFPAQQGGHGGPVNQAIGKLTDDK